MNQNTLSPLHHHQNHQSLMLLDLETASTAATAATTTTATASASMTAATASPTTSPTTSSTTATTTTTVPLLVSNHHHHLHRRRRPFVTISPPPELLTVVTTVEKNGAIIVNDNDNDFGNDHQHDDEVMQQQQQQQVQQLVQEAVLQSQQQPQSQPQRQPQPPTTTTAATTKTTRKVPHSVVVTTKSTTPTNTVLSTAPANTNPIRTLIYNWIFSGFVIPAVIFSASTALNLYHVPLHWTTFVIAAICAPILAIVQGSLGILQFRLRFGAAPVPIVPAHGVVYVTEQETEEDQQQQKQQSQVKSQPQPNNHHRLDQAQHRPPVRLLVIGDSLAIGVGQRYSSAPVLPQVIAHTLSRKLNRVVYWTCHGAPGATTGWIVRELERGVADDDDQNRYSSHHHHHHSLNNTTTTAPTTTATPRKLQSQESSSTEEQDVCNSDHQQSSSSLSGGMEMEQEDGVWRDRLTAHRRRFNPDLLGPYDIVVVLTGSNDLKSAFFPFLLQGEEAEFRKQAQERGGSYSKELRRLLETLYEKMSLQFQTLRAQVVEKVEEAMVKVEAATESVLVKVEAATESVREKVEETMELIAPPGSTLSKQLEQFSFIKMSSSTNNNSSPDTSSDHTNSTKASARLHAAFVNKKKKAAARRRNSMGNNSSTTGTEASASEEEEDDSLNNYYDENDYEVDDGNNIEDEINNDDMTSLAGSIQQGHSRHSPLVVLPGMPSRALPIFRTIPLRWLSCPVVEIMDRHKQELANMHPGQVLFVPPPGLDQVYQYEKRDSIFYQERCDESIALSLHDPPLPPTRKLQLEQAMQEYYAAHKSWTWRQQSTLFAEDQVHPNDEGYDFWGRYIAHAIVNEWQQQQQKIIIACCSIK